jgi:sugar phosphate isomerase/epimerase
MSRTISLAALSAIECAPPELVTVAATAGFNAVGMRLLPARATDAPPPIIGDTPMRRETLQRMTDTGISVLDIEVIWLQPEMRPTDYEAMFETGAVLGAKRVLVASGDSDENRMADNLGALCDLAKPYRLSLDIEFIRWTPLIDLDMALRILAKAGRPNAGVLVDCLHAARAGVPPAAMAKIDPARLGYFQLCDAPAEAPEDLAHEARFNRLAPGEGGLPLRAVIAALPHDLPISVEAPLVVAGAGPSERARLLYEATRRVLET